MPAELSRVETIFNEALETRAPQERAAFLHCACGGDADLRQRVDALLAAHDGAEDVLRLPYSRRTLEAVPVIREGPGTIIGRYKLLERIGEGGFGVVYMAEQQHPVRRKVALKVIKPGCDTDQVIARFEAERQALALMDHENIARVLDAGATDSGRPYFVMELVHGVPITEFCDANQLSPRERLELFVPVCRAVQHAHTKRIIHRDIKPTNVLVTLHEGVPVPKVIDFGVAKATGQQLTDKTLFTNFAQLVGTPLYMSPEQAEMTSTDVDTRSDVYSLGVLLYELLTGTTPLDSERLKTAAFDEVRRIIREEEPPRPSTRLSTMGENAKTISAQRKSDPKHLGQFVRGELDWIVMKALEKDRRRRYETASGLARDVQRYLNDEPVEACPASAGYKLRKFARKNRKALVTAAAFLILLGAATVVSTWQAIRATQAEAAANESAKQARLNADEAQRNARQARDEANTKAVALAAEQRARQDETKARQQAFAALRSMTDEVVERKFAHGTALTADDRAFLRSVIEQYDAFAAVKGDDADSRAVRAEGRFRVGRMRYRLSEFREAEQDFDQALCIYRQLAADFATQAQYRYELAACHNGRGNLLRETGRLPEAEKDYDQALSMLKELSAGVPSRPGYREELARSHTKRAAVMYYTGRPEEMEKDLDQAVSIYQQLAADFPAQPKIRQELATNHNLRGDLRRDTGRRPEAEQDYDQALGLQRRLVADFPNQPELHNDLAISCVNLAFSHGQQGSWATALRLLRESRPHHLAALKASPRHPTYRQAYRNYLNMLTTVHAGLLEPADAVRTAEICRDLAWNVPVDAYDAACFLSRCIPVVAKHDKLDDDQRQEAARLYGDVATKMLRDAVSKGYRDVAHIKKNTDLEPLRRREDFQKLVAELEAQRNNPTRDTADGPRP